MAKKMVDFLTLEDVAFLYDGLQDDLPAGLAGRLSQGVRMDAQFAGPVRELQAIAAAAGRPLDQPARIHEAAELHCELRRLLESGDDWKDPAEVLDPDGGRGLDLAALERLAHSFERRNPPPAGLGEVRRKLARALQAEAERAALVEVFVEGLLGHPAKAAHLLLEAEQKFLARSEAERATTERIARPVA